MQIFVNGAPREVDAAPLDIVLADLGYGTAVVATAVNGQFVAIEARAAVAIGEGDRLEIVAPMQGG